MRDTLGRDVVTERRACRVLGQARNTQRRRASVADDEPRLVKRIVWMASEYGRYGYRRITALLRAEGWWERPAAGRSSRLPRWVSSGKPTGMDLSRSAAREHAAACRGHGFQDFRRAVATHNAPNLTPEALQTLMQHRSSKTTLDYINLSNQVNQAAGRFVVPGVVQHHEPLPHRLSPRGTNTDDNKNLSRTLHALPHSAWSSDVTSCLPLGNQR